MRVKGYIMALAKDPSPPPPSFVSHSSFHSSRPFFVSPSSVERYKEVFCTIFFKSSLMIMGDIPKLLRYIDNLLEQEYYIVNVGVGSSAE